MTRLRDPEKGCPWDRAQTHESIRRNVLEEAYETAHAIDRGDTENLREELGEIRSQMEALSARLSTRTEAVNRLLEAIDTAGPLPERTPAPPQEGEAPAPEGAVPTPAPAAVSKTAQRVFEAVDAVQADAPETAKP